MTDSVFTVRLFLDWHDSVQWFAYGLLGALLMFVLLQYVRAGRSPAGLKWFGGNSLGTSIGVGAILLGLIPILALVVLLTERSAYMRHDRMETRIEEMATAVANSVERFVDKHVSGMTAAASSINASGDFSADSIQESLLLYHEIYADFLTMLGTDAQGNIIAGSSRFSGRPARFNDIAGFSVADREYFKVPMANGFPFVSQAFRGRGFGADPIVAISASLRDEGGNRIGVVEGSLNLSAFEKIDHEHPHIDEANLIILDTDNEVIYASPEAKLVFLENLSSDAMVTSSEGLRQGVAFDYDDQSLDRARNHMAAYATTSLGWRVFVRVPTDPIAQQMLGDYKVGLMLLFVTAAISLLMAGALTRRFGAALGQVNNAIDGLSVDGSSTPVVMPKDMPSELEPVFNHMQDRAAKLRGAYKRLNNSIDAGEKLRKELTQAIALKEVEIAERTAELERANEKLSSQSKLDPLTKIANRREFEAFEKRVWNLGARERVPVAVVLIDIDHFKGYNDTLGHQAGDNCLKLVAKALEDCANRPLDLVARYGGEEFVAVLGGAAVADALIVAENMRNAVLDLEMVHPESPEGIVTVSVGAASVVPTHDEEAMSLIKAADEALYHAKGSGRNCVVFRRDDDFVVYNPDEHSLDSTNIIKMLAGDRHRKAKGPPRS
ncbi:MAG: diguanylate cyclase [Woeseiaceae bacterium]|nr:diguanylate cyclase [Woeseiaceae bacterium]